MSHLKANWQKVTVKAAGGQILGPNVKRKGLILSSGVANGYWINAYRDAASGDGLFIPPNMAPTQLGGDLCLCWLRESISGLSAVADQTITIVEIFGDEPD